MAARIYVNPKQVEVPVRPLVRIESSKLFSGGVMACTVIQKKEGVRISTRVFTQECNAGIINMSSLRLHGEECVATLWEAKGPTDPIDGPILVPSLFKFDGTVELADAMPRWEEAPPPKPKRPDEFWWIRSDEDMPLEPAEISFEGDKPAKVLRLGDDSCCGTSIEDFEITHVDEDGVRTVSSRLELVQRILPPGRVAEVAAKLREIFDSGDAEAHWAIMDEALALLGQPKEAA